VIKRIFDILVSSLGLLFCLPLFLVVAVLIKLDSKGPVFFTQRRIGKNFRPFWIYKFRSMAVASRGSGSQISPANDPRITPIGKLLRKSKIDELPQLFNVLKGDMSMVGPRPEVPKYVQLFLSDYEEILQVQPGITDLASLKYSDEGALLAKSQDPEDEYANQVLPDKIELAKEYVRSASFFLDLSILVKTPLRLLNQSFV
jgi:lipopolysaccharide/colanic/teichoic acid biosynthesis glycosyltransferase